MYSQIPNSYELELSRKVLHYIFVDLKNHKTYIKKRLSFFYSVTVGQISDYP